MRKINLQINLKSACNLRCSYCALSETSKNNYDEDISNLIQNTYKLVEKCKDEDYEIAYFGLFGGEPTLVPPETIAIIFNIIRENFQAVKLSIQTNGTLLTEEYVTCLQNSINSQTRFSIGFSMDGCKSQHDKFRCSSYDIALENLLRIKQNTNIEVFTVATIGPQHKDYQEEMNEWINLMRDNNIRVGLSYVGGDEGIPNPEFYSWYTDWIIQNRLINNAFKLFSPNWCYRNDCDKMLLDLSDGDIFQCENTFAKEHPIDNWLDKPLSQVYQTRQCHVDAVPKEHEDCQACEYKTFCNNGCPLYRINGKPSDCEAIKKTFNFLKAHNINWKHYIGFKG